jgi:hypothetical protein
MGAGQTQSSTGLYIGTIIVSYLHKFIKKLANPILFADDTSIIISNMNPEEFKSNISLVLNETITWFNRNFVTLLVSLVLYLSRTLTTDTKEWILVQIILQTVLHPVGLK